MYELEEICCTCLQPGQRLLRLSAKDSSGLCYRTKMASPPLALDIANEAEDGAGICEQCCRDVDFVCEFRERCVRSVARLRDYLSQLRAGSSQRGSTAVHLLDIIQRPVKQEHMKAEHATEENEEGLKACTSDRPVDIKTESDEQLCAADIILCVVKTEKADFECKTEYGNVDARDDFHEDYSFTKLNDIKSDIEIEDGELFQHGADLESADSSPKFSDIANKVRLEDEMCVRNWPSCSRSGPVPHFEATDVGHISQNDPRLDAALSAPYDEIAHPAYTEQCTSISFHENMVLTRSDQQQFECGNCNNKFASVKLLTSHSDTCVAKKSLKCKICNKIFCGNNLKRHSVIHIGEKPFQCKICSKSFTQSSKLKSHTLIHTGEKPFQCKICNKTFTESSNLKKHALIHTGAKPFQCKICNKLFSRSSNLKTHSLIHTGEKPFQCKICNKSFIANSKLKRHTLIHTGEKPFQCKICNKSFAVSSSLKKHALIHTEPFQCKICNETFTEGSDFNKHALLHTGPKPFQCKICNKLFPWSSNLKIHSLIHTGEKPFQCKICNKSFIESSKLKRHTLIHTGEKPFQCEICSKTFTHKGNLKKHVLIHTALLR